MQGIVCECIHQKEPTIFESTLLDQPHNFHTLSFPSTDATPCTLHLTPYTLNPSPYTLRIIRRTLFAVGCPLGHGVVPTDMLTDSWWLNSQESCCLNPRESITSPRLWGASIGINLDLFTFEDDARNESPFPARPSLS